MRGGFCGLQLHRAPSLRAAGGGGVQGDRPQQGGDVLRVATYNVLAPFLCSQSRFPRCRPADLEEAIRWDRLVERLEEVLASPVPTVLCLQEVGEDWAARLHLLLQRRGWHFVYGLSPQRSPSRRGLGVGLAWDNGAFELQDVLIARPGGEVVLPPPPLPPSWLARLGASLARVLSFGLLAPGNNPTAAARLEVWKHASDRTNRLVAARLRDRRTGRALVVATYHMPCLFDKPPQRQTKAIHCAAVRDVLARFVGRCRGTTVGAAAAATTAAAAATDVDADADVDVVLAGDFNTKPYDSEMELVMSGRMDAEDVAYPAAVPGLSMDAWLLGDAGDAGLRLRSAYKEALGGVEPPFTNNAWIEGRDEPFRETIDYILVSPGVDVLGVRKLPGALEPNDPVYPSIDEPSDHLLLSADLRLGSRGGSAGGSEGGSSGE